MGNKPSSLFVGRWQPFHKGHKKLIETVLKKGKSVVVAIRDTEVSDKDPYSTFERWTMIQNALKKYGDLVKIIVIPDIDEICYGREVGYNIRKIDLDEKTEKISGTGERILNSPGNPIVWLTGQSGAGKTTLARDLQEKLGAVVLDGDEMRKSISEGLGFSKDDRETHNLRVARLAKVLSKKSIVVVSVIAPFRKTRAKIDKIINPVWVYVKRDLKITKERPYEAPDRPDVVVDSDNENTNLQSIKVINFLKKNY